MEQVKPFAAQADGFFRGPSSSCPHLR